MPRLFRLRSGQRHGLRAVLAGAAMSALGACSTTDFQARAVGVPSGGDVQGEAAPAYERGKTHLVADDLGLALEAFREARRADPDSVAALNAIAITYGRLGHPDAARRYFEQALAVDPASAPTLNNFGRALLEEGDTAEALALLERAAELARDNPTIAANIAQARHDMEERRARTAAVAEAAETAPAIWIERSSARLQTLITETGLALPDGARSSDPRVAHVADAVLTGGRASPADPPTPPASDRAAPPPAGPRLEVSNGAGRRHMAARMRRYLGGRGLEVDRLTNADWFGHRRSVILYRPGFAEEASRLAAMLPITPALEETSDQRSGVRLRLGGDLLDFDATLPRRS